MRYGWYPLEWYETERGGILSTATGGILWSDTKPKEAVSFRPLQVVSFGAL